VNLRPEAENREPYKVVSPAKWHLRWTEKQLLEIKSPKNGLVIKARLFALPTVVGNKINLWVIE
jgi:hypothetical protein